MCDFDDTRLTKRPYELLLIGRKRRDDDKCDVAPLELLPDRRVIVSVPCSIHSRKPPLGSQFCLILFVKGCTIECAKCKLQHCLEWNT